MSESTLRYKQTRFGLDPEFGKDIWRAAVSIGAVLGALLAVVVVIG